MPDWLLFREMTKERPVERAQPQPELVDDETAAYMRMEAWRWPHGVVCPFCSTAGAYYIAPANGVDRRTHTGSRTVRRIWKCRACRRQFSVLIGTCLEGTRMPLTAWFNAFELLKGGELLPIRTLAAHIGVSSRTAWLTRNRIRQYLGFDDNKPVRIERKR